MAGRTNTREDHRQRTDFFEQGKKLSEAGDPAANCWLGALCYLGGIPIDYTVPAGTTDDSHNLDHYKAWADYPELRREPTNFRHAHRYCNEKRKKSIPSGGLGDPVPQWW